MVFVQKFIETFKFSGEFKSLHNFSGKWKNPTSQGIIDQKKVLKYLQQV